MNKAEKFACKYAGFETPPTKQDALNRREDNDAYHAYLEGYEQGLKTARTDILKEMKRRIRLYKKLEKDAKEHDLQNTQFANDIAIKVLRKMIEFIREQETEETNE